nr:uncharacterized protein LOC109189836 [Ipomoea batatas]
MVPALWVMEPLVQKVKKREVTRLGIEVGQRMWQKMTEVVILPLGMLLEMSMMLMASREVNKLFLPILQHEHFYLLCVDFVSKRVEIIDNSTSTEPTPVKYGDTPENVLRGEGSADGGCRLVAIARSNGGDSDIRRWFSAREATTTMTTILVVTVLAALLSTSFC